MPAFSTPSNHLQTHTPLFIRWSVWILLSNSKQIEVNKRKHFPLQRTLLLRNLFRGAFFSPPPPRFLFEKRGDKRNTGRALQLLQEIFHKAHYSRTFPGIQTNGNTVSRAFVVKPFWVLFIFARPFYIQVCIRNTEYGCKNGLLLFFGCSSRWKHGMPFKLFFQIACETLSLSSFI